MAMMAPPTASMSRGSGGPSSRRTTARAAGSWARPARPHRRSSTARRIPTDRKRGMTMAMAAPSMGTMGRRGGGPSGLADVLDVLLDKGLVIDAFVRVSLIGIELLTVDARVVVASVDTYLRFAEAVNRLDLTAVGAHAPIQDIGR